MTDYGDLFDDPFSAMFYNSITMTFIIAHAFASIWVMAHGKNTDLDALKAA